MTSTTHEPATETEQDETLAANPGEALRDAGQKLLSLLVSRASEVAMDRVDGLADKLSGMGEGGGAGLGAAVRGGKALAEGKSPFRAALSAGFGGIKEKIKGMFGGGGGGGKKPKITNIVEETDIGLPLRVTYNLWTQFEDFPGFMKKVKSVEQASEEKVNWKAQIFWSNRSWEATIVEQVPDSHIVWRSKGAKGHVNGAVSFTELGTNLTRVLLVMEYYPQGLFERTGNIWRAQGRRARLEFKHFRRNAMASAILRRDEIEGWRGEIRDSEVVMTHEEALDKEREDEAPEDEATEHDEAGEARDEDWDDESQEPEGEAAEYDEAQDYDDEAEGPEQDDAAHDDAEYDEDDGVEGEYADDEYDDYDDRERDEADDDRDIEELDEDRVHDTNGEVEPAEEEAVEEEPAPAPRRRRAATARRGG
jgi:hypothetical protein